MSGNPISCKHADNFGYKPFTPPRSSYGYTFVGLRGFRSKFSARCDGRGFPDIL